MEGSINMDLEEQVVRVGTQELGRVEERKVGTAKEGSKRKPFMPHLTLQEFNPEQKVLTVELSDDQLLSEEQTNQSGGAQKPILPLKNKGASPK